MRALIALFLAGNLSFGCEVTPGLWSPAHDGDPLFRFERDDKVGFIDAKGKVVIEPSLPLHNTEAFHDGVLSLGTQGPFINTTGKQVLGDELDRVWDFSDGLAPALKDFAGDSPWGYIDHTGSWAISPRFPSYPQGFVSTFSEGLAAIETEGKVGYIDKTGHFVIPQQFASGSEFANGFARVAVSGPCSYYSSGPCSLEPITVPGTGPGRDSRHLQECRWSYIDKSGKRLFASDFEQAQDFSEGLAAVKVAGKWGFIDKRGIFLITPRYPSAEGFSNGLAFVNDGTTSGFIDTSGTMRFTTKYANSFSEDLAAVSDGHGTYMYLDKNGQQAIPETFGAATSFIHGLAHVQLMGDDGELAYIDHTGKHVFTYRRTM
ncbi:MAG: WG repeat-containing protein [Acidobacteriota bacterium]